MLRALACVFAITVPLLSQGISVPFTMNGGAMQVQGAFTLSGGSVCCSGVIDIGGEQGTFCGGPSYSSGSCIEWRFTVHLDEATYVLKFKVDTQGMLTGYYYVAGSHAQPVSLYP